ncbi:dTDP-4-dehydrorhamnose reductase [Flagellimonas beolgyonensis]|uniref:dTDP-4-dehydrorhamnose reductase n=1 Tax=Flagellimonas beolgyonensis TaxID=864064 RepID=UPI003D65248F
MGKIIVTGSEGQLGRTLQELSPDFDCNVHFTSSTELDITNPKSIESVFQKGHYDYCINCAAYTNVEQSEITPELAYKVNAEGVKNLTEACDKYNITLIHISTDYVFDGNKTSPYTVQDVPNPINQYGKSKLQGEEYIRAILRNHYILRTSWLYSKKYGYNFYRTVLQKAMEGQELRITDEQTGCPTNTENLAKFIVHEVLAGKVPFGTHHFTDGKPMTWYDFAKQILEENELTDRAKLTLDRNYRILAKRPQNSVLI